MAYEKNHHFLNCFAPFVGSPSKNKKKKKHMKRNETKQADFGKSTSTFCHLILKRSFCQLASQTIFHTFDQSLVSSDFWPHEAIGFENSESKQKKTTAYLVGKKTNGRAQIPSSDFCVFLIFLIVFRKKVSQDFPHLPLTT